MALINTTDATFENEVLKQSGLVLVDFWAEWCGPCKALTPILNQLSQERTDVTIAKVNIDQNSAITNKYNIRSIPTLILVKDGDVVATRVGHADKGALDTWLNEYK